MCGIGRSRVLVCLLLAALVLPSGAAAAGTERPIGPAEPIGPEPHSSFVIEGDRGFETSDAVRGGTGTPGDPYVIEGWEITIERDDAISIRNTSRSLVIRNVTLRAAIEPGLAGAGIRLVQAENVRIENVSATGLSRAVMLEASPNVSIQRSILLRSGAGIWASDSANLEAIGNNIRADGQFSSRLGIFVRHSDRIALIGNNVALDGPPGFAADEIRLENATNVVMEDNVIGSDGWIHQASGLWMVDVRNATIRNNIFLSRSINPTMFNGLDFHRFAGGPENFDSFIITPDNRVNGAPILFYNRCQDVRLEAVLAGQIIISNCAGVHVSNTTIRDRRLGLVIAHSVGVVVSYSQFIANHYGFILDNSSAGIYHNDFIDSGWAARYQLGKVRLYADYPVGGNFWSDLSGVDECAGRDQDSCPDADGFFDAPFGNPQRLHDRYPLASPIDATNTWPKADFRVEMQGADVDRTFVFNATLVSDREDPAEALRIRWDFDGDSRWDTNWTTDKTVVHRFPAPGVYLVRMEVQDSGGLRSVVSLVVTVNEPSVWQSSAVPVGITALLAVIVFVVLFSMRRPRTGPHVVPPGPVSPIESAREEFPEHSLER